MHIEHVLASRFIHTQSVWQSMWVEPTMMLLYNYIFDSIDTTS